MGWELIGCFKLGSTLGECIIFTFMGRGLCGQEVLSSNAWIELFVTMIGFTILQTTLSFIYQNYLRTIIRFWLSVSLVLLTFPMTVLFVFKLRGLWIISLVSLLMKLGIRSLTIMMLPKASHLVLEWNRHVFGNIFWRKKRLLARLGGIQRALEDYYSHGLIDLEKQLIAELEEVLSQEEIIWLQKSRQDWLCLGDRNTTYFHKKIASRRRRNNIAAV